MILGRLYLVAEDLAGMDEDLAVLVAEAEARLAAECLMDEIDGRKDIFSHEGDIFS